MNVFRELRKKRGISQVTLADRLGMSQTAISQWEVGRNLPDTETVKKLCDFYGVSADYILGRTDNPLSLVPRETPYLQVSPFEKQVLEAYRELSSAEQAIICRSLGLTHPAERRTQVKNA